MAKKLSLAPKRDPEPGKADEYSFNRDPGSLDNKADHEFTFADIPVLGQEAKLKEQFSFEHQPDAAAERNAREAALASFEQILREQPPVATEGEPPPETDVSHGLDQGFLAEQRQMWQAKVQRVRQERRRLITIKLAYVLVPIFLLAGAIYLAGSSWYKYQAEQDAKRNYVIPKRRQLLSSQQAEEARKYKEAMEAELAKADHFAAANDWEQALPLYQALAERNFFKPVFIKPLLGRCLAKLGRNEEALAAYREALAAGGAEPPVIAAAAELMLGMNLPDDAVAALQAGIQANPEQPLLLAMLAEASHRQGNPRQALETFQKLKRDDLNERQLDILGRLLIADGRREEARKVFFYSAKRYNLFSAYLAAAELAPKPADRIEIMANASGKLTDKREVNAALVMLARYLNEAGRKGDALSQLAQVDVAALQPKDIAALADLAVTLEAPLELFEKVALRLQESFANEAEPHMVFQDRLCQARREPQLLDWYGKWWAKRPNNAVVNFLYGRVLRSGSEAIARLRQATVIKPEFLLAWQALAEACYTGKQWRDAETAYAACCQLDPGQRDNRLRLALVQLYGNLADPGQVVDDFASYLQEQQVAEPEPTRLLLDLAQRLPDPARADRYLERLRLLPGMATEYRAQRLRTDLIFGRLTDADFNDPVPRAAREIQQLYLLGKGRTKEVLMMPTPAEDFPEFWKVFLCRLGNLDWQDNAVRLLERYQGSPNSTVALLVSMWLGQRSATDVRALAHLIPPDQEALFYFILAEEFRRINNPVAAKVCYTSALNTCRPNLLAGVIAQFNRPRRNF